MDRSDAPPPSLKEAIDNGFRTDTRDMPSHATYPFCDPRKKGSPTGLYSNGQTLRALFFGFRPPGVAARADQTHGRAPTARVQKRGLYPNSLRASIASPSATDRHATGVLDLYLSHRLRTLSDGALRQKFQSRICKK